MNGSEENKEENESIEDGMEQYKGVYDNAELKGVDVSEPVGFDVLVDGIVPIDEKTHADESVYDAEGEPYRDRNNLGRKKGKFSLLKLPLKN
ncbi:hypothetical protein DEO72_LG7g1768 [Vigna unguiculata]|uniref:Uncharacterized protein n=1 Tax=Vigna unguiculata TaxID=3917 RepID=A0A4D6MHI3_VIGUN|nr:hypothetical protein DEO72_LG7g1768 [Vigna unguiculata]